MVLVWFFSVRERRRPHILDPSLFSHSVEIMVVDSSYRLIPMLWITILWRSRIYDVRPWVSDSQPQFFFPLDGWTVAEVNSV